MQERLVCVPLKREVSSNGYAVFSHGEAGLAEQKVPLAGRRAQATVSSSWLW